MDALDQVESAFGAHTDPVEQINQAFGAPPLTGTRPTSMEDLGRRTGAWDIESRQRQVMNMIPFGSAFRAGEQISAERARRRLEAGTPESDDQRLVEHQAHLEQMHAERTASIPGAVTEGMTHLPALFGEMFIGGGLLRGAGLIGEGGTLAARGSRLLATTAPVPELYAERAVQNNMRAGRDPGDLRGLPGAFSLAVLQNAVFGAVGGVGHGLGPAGRVAAGTATGMGAQAGADVVASVMPAWMEMDTGYGLAGDIVRAAHGEDPGKDALKEAIVQGATFTAFAVLHGLPQRRVQESIQDSLQRMRRAGVSPERAGTSLSSLLSDAQTALRANPELSVADAMRQAAEGQRGPARAAGTQLADVFTERPQPEAPSVPPPGVRPPEHYEPGGEGHLGPFRVEPPELEPAQTGAQHPLEPIVQGVLQDVQRSPSNPNEFRGMAGRTQIGLRLNPDSQTVKLGFRGPRADVGEELRPGSLDIGRALRSMLPRLQQAGLGVEYEATDANRGQFRRGKGDVYARALGEAGFEQTSGPGVDEAKTYTWKPKAAEAQPTTVESLRQASRSGRAVSAEDVYQAAGLNEHERAFVDGLGNGLSLEQAGLPIGLRSRQRAHQIAAEIHRKLGLPADTSLVEALQGRQTGRSRTERLPEEVQRGGEMSAEERAAQRRARMPRTEREQRHKALEDLADQLLKEAEHGDITPERHAEIEAESRRRAGYDQEAPEPTSRGEGAERGAGEPPSVPGAPGREVQPGAETAGAAPESARVPAAERAEAPQRPAQAPGAAGERGQGPEAAAASAEAPRDLLSHFRRLEKTAPNGMVDLADLREASGLPRAEFDAEIERLRRAGELRRIGAGGSRAGQERRWDAGIRGEGEHFIAVERPENLEGEVATPKVEKQRSLYQVVKKAGGIDPNSASFLAQYAGVREAREFGVQLGVFKKGGRGLDELAQELHISGHIDSPEPARLLELLANKSATHQASLEQKLAAELHAYEAEQERLRREEPYVQEHPEALAEALRDRQEGERAQAEREPGVEPDEGDEHAGEGGAPTPGENLFGEAAPETAPAQGKLFGFGSPNEGQVEYGLSRAADPTYRPNLPSGVSAEQQRAINEFLGGDGGAVSRFMSQEGGFLDLAAIHNYLADKASKIGEFWHKLTDDTKVFLAPASRGEHAAIGAGIGREKLAEMARKKFLAEKALKAGEAHMDNWIVNAPDEPTRQARFLQFTDAIERGNIPSLPPELRGIAETIREQTDQRTQAVVSRDLIESTIDNYMGHLWKKPGSTMTPDQIGMALRARRPLTGPESYRRQRTLPTYHDGIDAGLEPVDWNPVRLALLNYEQIDKSVMGRDWTNELHDQGLWPFVRLGDSPPEGWRRIDDRISRVFKPREPGEAGPALVGHYYTPEPIAKLIDNYLQPGLRGNMIYDAVRGFGNLLNQFQLGFSAFHAGFVIGEAPVSAVSLGLQEVSRGQFSRGLRNILKAPLAPYRMMVEGSKVLREYGNPGSQGAETAAIVDALESAGGRARMDAFYDSGHLESFRRAIRSIRSGQGGFGGALYHALPALAEATSKPVMEYLVPRMKLGAFAQMAQSELERLGPGVDANTRRQVLGRAWDSVENRLGQLTYDNVFWNRVTKDVAMAGVRSTGWTMGTERELGGGIRDIPSSVRGVRSGEGISPRLAYTVALPMVAGLYGAIYQYLATGKGPEDTRDLFFPRTGGINRDGTPARVALPTYMRDVNSVLNRGDEGPLRIMQNVAEMARNKVNPGVSTAIQMLFNNNFYGGAIRNPNDPAVKQALDTARHLLGSFESFSVRSYRELAAKGADPLQAAQGFVGITPATSTQTHTAQQQRAAESGRRIMLSPLERLRREGSPRPPSRLRRY